MAKLNLIIIQMILKNLILVIKVNGRENSFN